MKYCLYKGKRLTAEEFYTIAGPDYKKRNDYPYCEACGEGVIPCNLNTPETVPFFRHHDRPQSINPMDDCILVSTNAGFKRLQPKEYDTEGHRRQKDFFEIQNIKSAFFFWKKMCHSPFTDKNFYAMLQRADQNRIWFYKNLEIDQIPFILLLLETFDAVSTKGNAYQYNFVLNKNWDIAWNNGGYIKKIFANGGVLDLVENDTIPFSNSILDKSSAFISNEIFSFCLERRKKAFREIFLK